MCLTFGPLRSVTAKTRMKSAWGPLVIQFFAPLSTQPPLVLLGARHHRLRVGAAHRLGEPEAPELRSAGHGSEDPLLLLVGAELVDGSQKSELLTLMMTPQLAHAALTSSIASA